MMKRLREMRKGIAIVLCLLLVLSALAACGNESGGNMDIAENSAQGAAIETALPMLDMSAWQYNEEDDVYYQIGLSYCENPADESYETMAFYVPGAYFNAEENEDGSFTCELNESGSAGSFSAKTAPIVIPVNTPGYAAMAAPTEYGSSFGYGSVSDYTNEGIILIVCGARGRDAGAPSGVADFKAAIRYARYVSESLPGDWDAIFSCGMSGGGAQSALLGATGNAPEYEDYLSAIGAISGISDAVLGSMCWCPITNLDTADAAYEWMMGSTRSGLSDEEQAISDALASSYPAYINGLKLYPMGHSMGDGALTLGEDLTSGSYYEYVKETIEESLEHFLSDTEFPYDASSASPGGFGGGGMRGGFGSGMQGGMGGFGQGGGGRPDFADGEIPDDIKEMFENDGFGQNGGGNYEDMDGIGRTQASSGLSLSGTYETAEDYIAALNSEGEWVAYDADSGSVTITSIEDFVSRLKNASKSLGAFDQLDRGQGENTLFGYDDGSGAHFDETLSGILEEQGSEYAADYAEDLAKVDALGKDAAYRLKMYTPMYYVAESEEGFGTADVASFWRIRTGINQGDTALSTELNLATALNWYPVGVNDTTSVDFETVWGQGHTMAERSGESTENFIAWIKTCMAAR